MIYILHIQHPKMNYIAAITSSEYVLNYLFEEAKKDKMIAKIKAVKLRFPFYILEEKGKFKCTAKLNLAERLNQDEESLTVFRIDRDFFPASKLADEMGTLPHEHT